jgi:cytochrome c oxidase assembly protein subunit 15
VLLALVVTGAFVTAAGPHAGGQDIPRVGNLEDALYVHVRATAVFGIGFLVLVAALLWLRRALRPELVLALALLAVLLGQMAVGEVQWRNQLPWWLVLLHVSLATVVFGSMTGLAARLVARRRHT